MPKNKCPTTQITRVRFGVSLAQSAVRFSLKTPALPRKGTTAPKLAPRQARVRERSTEHYGETHVKSSTIPLFYAFSLFLSVQSQRELVTARSHLRVADCHNGGMEACSRLSKHSLIRTFRGKRLRVRACRVPSPISDSKLFISVALFPTLAERGRRLRFSFPFPFVASSFLFFSFSFFSKGNVHAFRRSCAGALPHSCSQQPTKKYWTARFYAPFSVSSAGVCDRNVKTLYMHSL